MGVWAELLTALFKDYGLVALIAAIQVGLIVYLFRLLHSKEKDNKAMSDKLLELSERRVQDAREEREDYEELARSLNTSIDLLIKVFRKRNGDNGG